jgi:hypothetical protein
MLSLETEKQLRAVQKLSFCYLCGDFIDSGDVTNRDHVPPKSCFTHDDRRSPLILRAHKRCNDARTATDETMGQFFSSLTNTIVTEENLKVKFEKFNHSDLRLAQGAFTNVNVYGEIERWVQAFHAALYREPCSPQTYFGIQTPIPLVVPTEIGPKVDKFRPMHFLFVGMIKRNRAVRNIDKIICYNGKVTYECVWKYTEEDNAWHCIFAIDFHNWGRLGKALKFEAHGCTGHYRLPSREVPTMAAKATELIFPYSNFDLSNPFGN